MHKKAQKNGHKNLYRQGYEGAQNTCEYACRYRASIQMPQVRVFDSRPKLRNPTVFDDGVGRWNVFFEYVFQGRCLPDSFKSAPIMPPMEA